MHYLGIRPYSLSKVLLKLLLLLVFSVFFINFAKAETLNNKQFDVVSLKNDFKKVGSYDGSYFPALKRDDKGKTFHFISSDGSIIDFADGNIVDYSFKPVLSYYKLRKSVKVGNDSSYREFYVNAKGEYLFNATFNKIALSKYGYALVQVKEGDNVYLLDMSGRVLRKYPPMYDFHFINNPNYFARKYNIKEGSSQYYHESLVSIDGKETFKNNDYLSIMNVSDEDRVMTRKKSTDSHIFVDPLFFTLDEKALYTKTNKAGTFIYEPFKNGLAIAKKDKKMAVIRPDESFAIAFGKYDSIKRTYGDRFIASRKDYYDLLDLSAKVMKSFKKSEYGELRSYTDTAYIFDKGGRFYYFDKNLKKISDTGYTRAYNFNKGYALAFDKDKIYIIKDKSYKGENETLPSKVINPDKTLKEKDTSDIIDPVFYENTNYYTLKDLSPRYIDKKYEYKGVYSDKGLFVFEDQNDYKKVIINHKGELVSDRKYKDFPKVGEISTSLVSKLRVENNAILDEFAKAKNSYSDLVYYKDKGVYLAQKKVGRVYKYGLLDKSTKPITAFEYDDMLEYKDGKFVFRKAKKVGLLDYRARKILDFKYEDIKISDDSHFAAKMGTYYYLINNSGKKISSKKYTYVGDFNKNNYCIAAYYEKQELINDRGDVVYSPESLFTTIVSLDDFNTLIIKIGDRYKEIKPKSMENKHGYDSYSSTTYPDIYIVGKNGKKGLADADFNEILPAVYDKIEAFSDGMIDLYTYGSRKKHIIYNPYSKKIFKYDNYDISSIFGTDKHILIKDSSTGLIGVADEKRIIIEPKYKGITLVSSKFYARNEEYVHNAKNLYVYDEKGNYEGVKKFNTAFEYSEGIGYIDSSFVDEEGRVILKDKFYSRSPFVNGYMVVSTADHRYMILSLDEIKKLGGIK